MINGDNALLFHCVKNVLMRWKLKECLCKKELLCLHHDNTCLVITCPNLCVQKAVSPLLGIKDLALVMCHLLARGLNGALLLTLLHSNDTERTPERSCQFPSHHFNIHSESIQSLWWSPCQLFPKLCFSYISLRVHGPIIIYWLQILFRPDWDLSLSKDQ